MLKDDPKGINHWAYMNIDTGYNGPLQQSLRRMLRTPSEASRRDTYYNLTEEMQRG